MKRYRLTDEGKEILKEIMLNLLIGPLAVLGFLGLVLFGLFLYCWVI